MSAESEKTQTMRRQVMVLMVVAALLVIALGLGIAYQHDQFARTAEVHFITENANNLAPGTSVRMSGVRIGAVSDVTMRPDQKVRVALTIGAETFASLRSDARAVLMREQLRAPALDLYPGSAAQHLPPSKPEIAYSRGPTLTEMADELRARVTPILDDVKQVTGTLRGRQDDMRQVIENVRGATQELASVAKELRLLAADARGRVATVGADVQRASAGLNTSVARAGALLGQAETGLNTVTSALPGLVQKADRTLEQLQGIALDGRTVSSAAATQVPSLLRSAAPLVDDAREVVQGAKQSWPISSLLPTPPSALLQIDSHDAKALREPATQ